MNDVASGHGYDGDGTGPIRRDHYPHQQHDSHEASLRRRIEELETTIEALRLLTDRRFTPMRVEWDEIEDELRARLHHDDDHINEGEL